MSDTVTTITPPQATAHAEPAVRATVSLNGGPAIPFDPANAKRAVDALRAAIEAANPRVEMNVTVPARSAAVAWLNAFLATSQDKERHVLYRTLSVEQFDRGLHLIGCDGTALFRAWVPIEEENRPAAPWPDISEDPVRSAIAMDSEGFGLGFMRSLLRITTDEARAGEELTITTAPCDDEATLALGTEFMAERLTLRACGQRIDLRTHEGPYPGWRHLQFGLTEAERVEGMTLAPRAFALLGKLRGVRALDLEFHGTNRAIDFIAKGTANVRGLLMPMRRDDDEEEPAAEQEPELPENEADAERADLA